MHWQLLARIPIGRSVPSWRRQVPKFRMSSTWLSAHFLESFLLRNFSLILRWIYLIQMVGLGAPLSFPSEVVPYNFLLWLNKINHNNTISFYMVPSGWHVFKRLSLCISTALNRVHYAMQKPVHMLCRNQNICHTETRTYLILKPEQILYWNLNICYTETTTYTEARHAYPMQKPTFISHWAISLYLKKWTCYNTISFYRTVGWYGSKMKRSHEFLMSL